MNTFFEGEGERLFNNGRFYGEDRSYTVIKKVKKKLTAIFEKYSVLYFFPNIIVPG